MYSYVAQPWICTCFAGEKLLFQIWYTSSRWVVTRVFEIAKCGLHIIIGPGVHLHHNTCCYHSEDLHGTAPRDEYVKVYAVNQCFLHVHWWSSSSWMVLWKYLFLLKTLTESPPSSQTLVNVFYIVHPSLDTGKNLPRCTLTRGRT